MAAVFTREESMESNIKALVEAFVNQVVAAVESDSVRRVQQAVAAAFSGSAVSAPRPGRPARSSGAVAPAVATPVKHRPKQFCPVPGCKNVAAPIFGMVCKDHKNVAKSKIRKYRAERNGKATPTSDAKPTATEKASKATPKVARARKLQGQYLGALKSLKGADRAKVKGVAKNKSVAEAVKLALTLKKVKA